MTCLHRSLVAVAGAGAVATVVHAEFTGWIASVRPANASQTFVDVYAGFSSATDRLLNVFNMNIAVNQASIVQSANAGESAWRPLDGASNSSSLDSFVTIGGSTSGGLRYASSATMADPSFSNYTTAGATTIPSQAGWYNSMPTSLDAIASTLVGSAGFPDGTRDPRSAPGPFGVWVAHILVNKAISNISWSVSFTGWAAFNDGANNADARMFHVIPAPGALALLGIAGITGGRRRRN